MGRGIAWVVDYCLGIIIRIGYANCACVLIYPGVLMSPEI